MWWIHAFSFPSTVATQPEAPPTVSPSGFAHYGDSSYLIISEEMQWEEARKHCQEKGAELASIQDAHTHSFLWIQMLKYGKPVWIGLNSNLVSIGWLGGAGAG